MTKSEALIYISNLPEDSDIAISLMDNTISSGKVEEMGISRQLLKYYVSKNYIRTVPYGKQKRYLLDDVKKFSKC